MTASGLILGSALAGVYLGGHEIEDGGYILGFFCLQIGLLAFFWFKDYLQKEIGKKTLRLEHIFLQSHHGLILFDGLARATKWNQEALNLLELAPDHLLTKEPVPDGWALEDASGQPLSEETHPLDKLIMEGGKQKPQIFRLFCPSTRSSKWLQFSGNVAPSCESSNTTFMLSIEDVTLEMDQKIFGENQRSFFNSIIEQSLHPTYIKAPEGFLTFANQSFCSLLKKQIKIA